MEVIDTLHY